MKQVSLVTLRFKSKKIFFNAGNYLLYNDCLLFIFKKDEK